MTALNSMGQQGQYEQKIDQMSDAVITAFNKMFEQECVFHVARITKGEMLPEGTEIVRFTVAVNGKNVTGMLRTKMLYDKATITDIEDRILKLNSIQKQVYDQTFDRAKMKTQNKGDFFGKCLASCDKSLESGSFRDSLLFKSMVYFIVSKSV